jgi:hypothetical protein
MRRRDSLWQMILPDHEPGGDKERGMEGKFLDASEKMGNTGMKSSTA